MGTSVMYGYGTSMSVVYFSEEVPPSDNLRLAAAVVWRGPPARRPGGLRGLLRKLRFRLGPFGLGLHFRWSEPWGGAVTGDGEQLTLYRARQRVVRVLGRTYPAPRDGRTLVLLVDEAAVSGPAVSVRLVTVPVQSRSRAELGSQNTAWNLALKSDPEVREFMRDWPNE